MHPSASALLQSLVHPCKDKLKTEYEGLVKRENALYECRSDVHVFILEPPVRHKAYLLPVKTQTAVFIDNSETESKREYIAFLQSTHRLIRVTRKHFGIEAGGIAILGLPNYSSTYSATS